MCNHDVASPVDLHPVGSAQFCRVVSDKFCFCKNNKRTIIIISQSRISQVVRCFSAGFEENQARPVRVCHNYGVVGHHCHDVREQELLIPRTLPHEVSGHEYQDVLVARVRDDDVVGWSADSL